VFFSQQKKDSLLKQSDKLRQIFTKNANDVSVKKQTVKSPDYTVKKNFCRGFTRSGKKCEQKVNSGQTLCLFHKVQKEAFGDLK
tara:strand:+ start:449 stop:700 length:252 start_codon:yes stop_codon:yes gene_type:complete